MLTAFAGELAGLVTAIVWAISSQLNGYMGRIVGATGITLLRLPFQFMFLVLFCVVGGVRLSFDHSQLSLLFLSALTGLAIGDLALYKAITIIGARAGVLLQSLCTSVTAIFGVLFLGEVVSWQMAVGIVFTTVGVGTVVTERAGGAELPGQSEPSTAEKRLGILLGLLCSVAFAISLIFLRAAMKEGLDPLWGGALRVLMAGGGLWITGYALGWSQAAVTRLRATRGKIRLLLFSCFLGALGMWTSCITLQHVQAGVGATILGLQPIWVIITYAVWARKLPSRRMMLGTLIAFSGTALVCLR